MEGLAEKVLHVDREKLVDVLKKYPEAEPYLKTLFPSEFDEDSEVDLSKDIIDNNLKIFQRSGMGSLIGVRNSGDFKNKAFYLSPYYSWRFVHDVKGNVLLYPTKK